MILNASDLLEQIAQRVKAVRLARNMSQAELAARVGASVATIKRFEKSGAGSVELLCNMAFALNAETELSEIFPLPSAQSLDDLVASRASRQRASKGSK